MTTEKRIIQITPWMRKLFLLVMLSTAGATCFASSVRQLGFEELCDRAQLIFEGRVIASETRYDESSVGFSTYIRFEVLDHLKGPNIEPEIELRFAGGKIGSQQLSVGDMVYPQVGEIGIFFVESLSNKQVNPLLGWSQGHFIERIDEQGHAGVFTSSGVAVISVQSNNSSSQTDPSNESKVVAGTAPAAGIELAPWKSSDFKAIGAREFKENIIDSVSE